MLRIREVVSVIFFGVVLLFALIINDAHAQKSPEQRRLDERAKALKTGGASHCAQYSGETKTECQEVFKAQMSKELRAQAVALINDIKQTADSKINAEIKEESDVETYSKMLQEVGISFAGCTVSKCLKDLWASYQKAQEELNCLSMVRARATEQGVAFDQSDTCAQVTAKIRAHQGIEP